MPISITDAKAQLANIVRRAESGEDIVLRRRWILESVSAAGAAKALAGFADDVGVNQIHAAPCPLS